MISRIVPEQAAYEAARGHQEPRDNGMFSSEAAVRYAVSSLHVRDFSHLGWIWAGCSSAAIDASGCNSESGANGRFVRRFS